MRLRIEGDHKAHVGLVAVDKAVYVLNKNKLTQSKVGAPVPPLCCPRRPPRGGRIFRGCPFVGRRCGTQWRTVTSAAPRAVGGTTWGSSPMQASAWLQM